MCLSPEVGDDPKASSSYKPQDGEMLVEVIKKVRARSMVMSVLENQYS